MTQSGDASNGSGTILAIHGEWLGMAEVSLIAQMNTQRECVDHVGSFESFETFSSHAETAEEM